MQDTQNFMLVVLSKLLTSGSTDTVTFLLAESLAPARRKWRFVVNEAEVKSFFLYSDNSCPNATSQRLFISFQVTLNAEEMKRALMIERYLLSLDKKKTSWNVEEDKKPLWNVEEDKKLMLMRCHLLGRCQADLQKVKSSIEQIS